MSSTTLIESQPVTARSKSATGRLFFLDLSGGRIMSVNPDGSDFGNPINDLTSPFFGQSTQTLANSLGSGGANGGFNPLYQIGGPRSIQLALKLQF